MDGLAPGPAEQDTEVDGMQGSLGVVVLAAIVALALVGRTSSLPMVGAVCLLAAGAVVFDQRRTRREQSTAEEPAA